WDEATRLAAEYLADNALPAERRVAIDQVFREHEGPIALKSPSPARSDRLNLHERQTVSPGKSHMNSSSQPPEPTLATNSLVGHYEIKSRLGVGGMGEVYLARDTKLDRNIALKILPVEVAKNRERLQRFVQEAKAAAGLNHPNIAQIYEIGQTGESPSAAETMHFIAMEFVTGQTL